MLQALAYPFDSPELLRHRKQYRRQLLADNSQRIPKRIAVLGGSTTADIVSMLELFLLNEGIAPTFYESEYAQYWQDAMFPNETLAAFQPDLIVVHTTCRNITEFQQDLTLSEEACREAVQRQYQKLEAMWDKLAETYRCPVIQNNFEFPSYRLLGSADASDPHGLTNFVTELNRLIYGYARKHPQFYVHDLMSLAACYGLDRWADPSYWYLYKYPMALQAIPDYAYSLTRVIRSIYGKNKKALVLDLDNTLWGGVIGDDGQAGIEIGQETAQAQGYTEFQQYLKAHQQLGVLLNVCSKNEPENAELGLQHPENVLHREDFIAVEANWEPKDQNILHIADQLNLLPDSFVFVDDNPAERAIVRGQIPGIAVPEIGEVTDYIRVLDHCGYFEMTAYSKDDAKRNEMYRENLQRSQQQKQYADYTEYLESLEMQAEIRDFSPVYLPRITQLTNKSNQFNLTTRRYTESEMQAVADSPDYVRLCGRLRDKFGDNGIVSIVIGQKQGTQLDIILWLMSCRVLKRDMELAMLDTLVSQCRAQGITTLHGVYLPTAKNKMVAGLYDSFGFAKQSETPDGRTDWLLDLTNYTNRNHVIRVNQEGEQEHA